MEIATNRRNAIYFWFFNLLKPVWTDVDVTVFTLIFIIFIILDKIFIKIIQVQVKLPSLNTVSLIYIYVFYDLSVQISLLLNVCFVIFYTTMDVLYRRFCLLIFFFTTVKLLVLCIL